METLTVNTLRRSKTTPQHFLFSLDPSPTPISTSSAHTTPKTSKMRSRKREIEEEKEWDDCMSCLPKFSCKN